MKNTAATIAVVGTVAAPALCDDTEPFLRSPVPNGRGIVPNVWDATSGQAVTVRNLSYNCTVATGQRVEFGFQASRPGGNTATLTNFSYMGS